MDSGLKLIGTWQSVYEINAKPGSSVRYPVGMKKSYTKSRMELRPDGTATVTEGSLMRLFKNKLGQSWLGTDSNIAVYWGGELYMAGYHTNDGFPFEALVMYDGNAQIVFVYRRVGV